MLAEAVKCARGQGTPDVEELNRAAGVLTGMGFTRKQARRLAVRLARERLRVEALARLQDRQWVMWWGAAAGLSPEQVWWQAKRLVNRRSG